MKRHLRTAMDNLNLLTLVIGIVSIIICATLNYARIENRMGDLDDRTVVLSRDIEKLSVKVDSLVSFSKSTNGASKSFNDAYEVGYTKDIKADKV